MKKKLIIPVAAIAVSGIIGYNLAQKGSDSPSAVSAANADSESQPLDKQAVREIVREYILENGDVLIEAVNNFQQREQNDQLSRTKEYIEENNDLLHENETSPFIGNPDADISIVEFFDYSCGYCRKALPDIIRIVETDSNVKVVFKEYPILGPKSQLLAKAALAVSILAPDKYFDFHKELMQKPISSIGAIKQAAGKFGVDADALVEKMESQEVANILQKNRTIARDLGARGTPAFVINDNFIPGVINFSDMQELIRNIRADNG